MNSKYFKNRRTNSNIRMGGRLLESSQGTCAPKRQNSAIIIAALAMMSSGTDLFAAGFERGNGSVVQAAPMEAVFRWYNPQPNLKPLGIEHMQVYPRIRNSSGTGYINRSLVREALTNELAESGYSTLKNPVDACFYLDMDVRHVADSKYIPLDTLAMIASGSTVLDRMIGKQGNDSQNVLKLFTSVIGPAVQERFFSENSVVLIVDVTLGQKIPGQQLPETIVNYYKGGKLTEPTSGRDQAAQDYNDRLNRVSLGANPSFGSTGKIIADMARNANAQPAVGGVGAREFSKGMGTGVSGSVTTNKLDADFVRDRALGAPGGNEHDLFGNFPFARLDVPEGEGTGIEQTSTRQDDFVLYANRLMIILDKTDFDTTAGLSERLNKRIGIAIANTLP